MSYSCKSSRISTLVTNMFFFVLLFTGIAFSEHDRFSLEFFYLMLPSRVCTEICRLKIPPLRVVTVLRDTRPTGRPASSAVLPTLRCCDVAKSMAQIYAN